jgi:PAT family beta-lactamase induction signal transducer AmpG
MSSQPPPADGATPARASGLGGLAAYLDRRTLVMIGLGFASGLPNYLIFDTLSAWLRDSGLSLKVISVFSLATLAYAVKFLWAPLADRLPIPGLTRWLGQRRAWMVTTQGVVIIGLVLIAGGDPKMGLARIALFAVLTGFSGATQDIVIDAWRIESSEVTRQGAMAAAYQWGYRIANIIAGAVPLVMADHMGWNLAYAAMAGLMGIGIVAAFAAPREVRVRPRPIPDGGLPRAPARDGLEWLARLAVMAAGGIVLGTALTGNIDLISGTLKAIGLVGAGQGLEAGWGAKAVGVWLQLGAAVIGLGVIVLAACPIPRLTTRPGLYLSHALGDPLADFFQRFGKTAMLILALICVYRLSDFVLNIMTPFYLDLGFSKTEVAEARKVFGVVMSMLGVFAGGLSVARLGVMRSMVIGAFALPITNTIFAWLATQGPDFRSLIIAIGIDNVVSGYAGTCLVAYMSSLTSAGFTITQYALFSSLYALPGKLLASQSGRIVEAAAQAAQPGGPFAPLRGLFANTPPTAFAQAMSKSHVSSAALGAGYVAFFFYSGLVGVLSMILAVLVARRTRAAPTALP